MVFLVAQPKAQKHLSASCPLSDESEVQKMEEQNIWKASQFPSIWSSEMHHFGQPHHDEWKTNVKAPA